MKVLLFTSYGGNGTTKDMRWLLKKYPFPKNRVGEIINYIENNAISLTKENIEDYLKTNKNHIGKLTENNNIYYYIYDEEINCLKSISIEDVDNNRPWKISEYDGSEYIQYLDYEIIDKELNYAKLKEL